MGDKKIHKQIYRAPDQDPKLKEVASALQMSEAEPIRQVIDPHVATLQRRRHSQKVWDEEMAFIREWTKKQPVPGGRTWRREELYDR